MREILFRGKAANRKPNQAYRTCYKNGDWVYGLLSKTENYAGFSEMTNTDGVSGIEVDKNTVGQYTGLADKNGKKIFEGDVIRFQKFKDEPLWIGVVVYENCLYIAKGVMPLSYEKREGEKAAKHGFEVQVSGINKSTIEVIGNIHDNPELMEANT